MGLYENINQSDLYLLTHCKLYLDLSFLFVEFHGLGDDVRELRASPAS